MKKNWFLGSVFVATFLLTYSFGMMLLAEGC